MPGTVEGEQISAGGNKVNESDGGIISGRFAGAGGNSVGPTGGNSAIYAGGNVGEQAARRPGFDWALNVQNEKDQSGLNPNRQKGFGAPSTRIETPTLSEMKAKQDAIVARFLTFAQRKASLVVELYNGVFL